MHCQCPRYANLFINNYEYDYIPLIKEKFAIPDRGDVKVLQQPLRRHITLKTAKCKVNLQILYWNFWGRANKRKCSLENIENAFVQRLRYYYKKVLRNFILRMKQRLLYLKKKTIKMI